MLICNVQLGGQRRTAFYRKLNNQHCCRHLLWMDMEVSSKKPSKQTYLEINSTIPQYSRTAALPGSDVAARCSFSSWLMARSLVSESNNNQVKTRNNQNGKLGFPTLRNQGLSNDDASLLFFMAHSACKSSFQIEGSWKNQILVTARLEYWDTVYKGTTWYPGKSYFFHFWRS